MTGYIRMQGWWSGTNCADVNFQRQDGWALNRSLSLPCNLRQAERNYTLKQEEKNQDKTVGGSRGVAWGTRLSLAILGKKKKKKEKERKVKGRKAGRASDQKPPPSLCSRSGSAAENENNKEYTRLTRTVTYTLHQVKFFYAHRPRVIKRIFKSY